MDWRKTAQQAWRSHKYSLLVIVGVTLAGLALYVHTYLAEARSPLAGLVDSLELKTYDTRFRARGKVAPSPAIVIVGIDQATLERLGSWPVSRFHYARLLDNLKADGARVVGFDLNFPKPDDKSGRDLVRRAREDYLKRTPAGRRDAAYLAQLEQMEREADADARFAESIRRSGNVILGYFFFTGRQEVRFINEAAQQEADGYLQFASFTTRAATDARGQEPPPLRETFPDYYEGFLAETNLAAFTEAANFRVGFFNVNADADGVIRHGSLVMKYGSGWSSKPSEAAFYPSFDVQVLRAYFGVSEQETVLLYNAAGVEAVELGARRIPANAQGRLLIHYQGGPFTYPHVSLVDVVDGRFSAGTFRDKVVLVAPTALAIGDFRPTPYAESYHAGVEIHANILDTILSQRYIHRSSREQLIDLGFILLFGFGAGFVLVRVRPAGITPLALGALAGFFFIAYAALVWFHSWLNVVIPAGVLLANSGLVAAVRVLVEEREKRRIHSAFHHYVPPGLLKELVKNPERLKLGGEERELTILFSDIRGFTSLAEKLTPLELTNFLNAYTDEMTDIVFRHWGTLDKYQGDAVMAFWGAPYEQDDHALRACAAALDMSRRVDELREQWRAENKPDINIGLGLSTGMVVVGNMGSRKRFNYTVLGDAVNLASRLEGVNKHYASRILVSEFTFEQAGKPLVLLERRLGHQYCVTPEEMWMGNGSAAAQKARQAAVHLASRLRLAPQQLLATRYALGADGQAERVAAEVEQARARDKSLDKTLKEAARSLRPLLFRQLDWIRVKGKREPVGLYELLSAGEDEGGYARLAELYDTGLQAYRGQQWQVAVGVFETILREWPGDGPAQLMAARCRQYLVEPPPPDWDGVYEMKTK
ncbi:MAG: adenylate/guanylate cyclase domain-containing protein [Acidobacteria bacterium]|nr:adenylate/guanylate cyclase domain-containing protein [Acidobacteriota bacterium]